MILVKVICYVNVENNFLTFIKYITFTRIMLGTPLGLTGMFQPNKVSSFAEPFSLTFYPY